MGQVDDGHAAVAGAGQAARGAPLPRVDVSLDAAFYAFSTVAEARAAAGASASFTWGQLEIHEAG